MKKEEVIVIIFVLCCLPVCIWIFLETVGLDMNIRLSDKTMLCLTVGIFAVMIGGLIWMYRQHVDYMEKQRVSGSDKALLLRRMAEEMGERYEDYTYVAAYVVQSSRRHHHVSSSPYKYYHLQPYVIAFNNSGAFIYRFQLRRGVIQLILPCSFVNWASSAWKYRIEEDSITLVTANDPSFLDVAEVMPITGTAYVIDKKISSAQNKAIAQHPLGIYQENEFWRLVNCLAKYPNSQQ